MTSELALERVCVEEEENELAKLSLRRQMLLGQVLLGGM
jgi:hypothetical protein